MSVTPTSWGGIPKTTCRIHPIKWRNASLPSAEESLLPFGLGRSYGDSCLNDQQAVLSTRGLDRFISFDEQTGMLSCEAGVSLEKILKLVTPKGWFLPVTPGTRYVTVGGAIANDVHGKNHHRVGSFGTCVQSFDLLRSDGSRRFCSREQNADWFRATLGGLGLTGLITKAVLELRKISSPHLDVEQVRMHHLDDFFRLSAESESSHEYTVAWVDGLETGNQVGRGIFIRGNHASEPEELIWKNRKQLPVPFSAPNGLLNPFSVKAFNALYRRKFSGERHAGREHFLPFFYPLDAVLDWNRLYGKRGFYQYQCVVPQGSNGGAIRQVLEEIGSSGQASFLAVLKIFGTAPKEGLLSFPRPGVTLAMDFPNTGDRVLKLMDRLDRIVLEAGGGIYPAKDARMSPEMFRSTFPALNVFQSYVDPAFSSSFWRRMMEEA